VLEAVLVRMRPTAIRSVSLSPVAHPGRYGLSPSDVTLHVGTGSSVRAEWEAALLGARYAAAASSIGLRSVGLVETSGGGGRPDANPIAPPRIAAVRDAVERLHVHVVELRTEAGAVAITLRPRVVAQFLRFRASRFIHELDRAGATRGLYVGIEDPAGSIVYAWGWLPTEGILYARPDLDSCGPITHSTPVFYRAPPCPLPRKHPHFGL
jgi:hypothetical protein